MKLIKTKTTNNYYLLSSDKFNENIKKGTQYYDGDGSVRTWGTGNCYGLDSKNIIASTIEFEERPLLDKDKIEALVYKDKAWRIGNKLKITTKYELNEGDGISIYEGFVISVNKGLALKSIDKNNETVIFKTQCTYWFGSILSQDVEILESTPINTCNLDVVKKAYTKGGADKYFEFDKFIHSLYLEQYEWDVSVSVEENWDYTTDFSKAEKGMTLHKVTGSDIIIDKVIEEDGKFIPMSSGVLFRDYNHYESPIYAYSKKPQPKIHLGYINILNIN
jgi:hypothetical protein